MPASKQTTTGPHSPIAKAKRAVTMAAINARKKAAKEAAAAGNGVTHIPLEAIPGDDPKTKKKKRPQPKLTRVPRPGPNADKVALAREMVALVRFILSGG